MLTIITKAVSVDRTTLFLVNVSTCASAITVAFVVLHINALFLLVLLFYADVTERGRRCLVEILVIMFSHRREFLFPHFPVLLFAVYKLHTQMTRVVYLHCLSILLYSLRVPTIFRCFFSLCQLFTCTHIFL